MRKQKFLILIIATLLIFTASCAKPEATVDSVEYAQVCTAANKNKVVAVQGFLGYGSKTPCMSMMRGDSKRDCAFKLLDNINVVGKEIIVYLREGKENNQAETPETEKTGIRPSSAFDKSQVKFRLNDGTVVTAQENVATPVTVTGKVELTDEGENQICSILVNKIEKR